MMTGSESHTDTHKHGRMHLSSGFGFQPNRRTSTSYDMHTLGPLCLHRIHRNSIAEREYPFSPFITFSALAIFSQFRSFFQTFSKWI